MTLVKICILLATVSTCSFLIGYHFGRIKGATSCATTIIDLVVALLFEKGIEAVFIKNFLLDLKQRIKTLRKVF